jgi:hypothetical protein
MALMLKERKLTEPARPIQLFNVSLYASDNIILPSDLTLEIVSYLNHADVINAHVNKGMAILMKRRNLHKYTVNTWGEDWDRAHTGGLRHDWLLWCPKDRITEIFNQIASSHDHWWLSRHLGFTNEPIGTSATSMVYVLCRWRPEYYFYPSLANHIGARGLVEIINPILGNEFTSELDPVDIAKFLDLVLVEALQHQQHAMIEHLLRYLHVPIARHHIHLALMSHDVMSVDQLRVYLFERKVNIAGLLPRIPPQSVVSSVYQSWDPKLVQAMIKFYEHSDKVFGDYHLIGRTTITSFHIATMTASTVPYVRKL